jgi:DNA-binding transcriptional regulator LsrR (DeoR family)
MKASGRRKEQADVLDVVRLFQEGRSISEIAKKLSAGRKPGVSRQRVVSLLQMAFTEHLVSVPTFDPKEVASDLTKRYPQVKFEVLSSRLCFAQLAAEQVLEWLWELCEGAEGPFIGIGGGRTLAGMIEQIPAAITGLGTQFPQVKTWLGQAKLTFVNATAGGLATMPELEASYLTCRCAQAIRAGAGENAPARPVVHTVSLSPSEDEQQVVADALGKTRVLITGVGDGTDAYCIKAIREKRLLTADEHQLAGELLFHPFLKDGQAVSVNGIAVKSRLEAGNGAAGHQGAGRHESAMLATLFDFEELRGRPTKEGRWVVVVSTCSPENKAPKAQALAVLLRHGLISHLCVSSDLAYELLMAT